MQVAAHPLDEVVVQGQRGWFDFPPLGTKIRVLIFIDDFTIKKILTLSLAAVCIFSKMSAFSSGAYKLGTSAVFNTVLISSMNISSAIWVSANRKINGLPSIPTFISSFFRSSLQSGIP